MTRKKPLIYNPDEEPKEMLIANFVIRQSLFEKVFKGIKNSSHTTPPQHFLLVGQRGMGKTTLLVRIKYAIEDDPQLSNFILPVRFPEEQYQIGCLPDLWEETALYLKNMNTAFDGLYEELQLHEKEEDYERICFEILTKKLKQLNKKIVFLIDNIGDLLHKFNDQENHRLREILMTSPHVQLIGASSEVLEHSFQYDKPFFEFFYQLKLEPLNKVESIELMTVLAENYDVSNKTSNIIKSKPHRIEALRRITGGVPRTLVLLFEIFIDYNDGSAFEDLEHLVDKVLPLYKARMDSLKPQQQKIIDALARAWEAISASEILEHSKLYRENITTNQVSSQLKQLAENQLVEIVDTGKRKKLYRIRERFFNIWYLMRNGSREHKEQVLWLIRFLESWCTVDELQEIANRQIGNLANGQYSESAAFYKAVALNNISSIDKSTKLHLLEHTEAFLNGAKSPFWAITIREMLNHKNGRGVEEDDYPFFEEGYIKQAESILLRAVKEDVEKALFSIALFYEEVLKNKPKAEEFYLKAIEKNQFIACRNFFNFYWRNNKHQKAMDLCVEMFQRPAFFEKGQADALRLLIAVIKQGQYNFLFDEYTKENSLLMQYMLPVYYVVAWYLRDELPGEYEKAGSEIKETIDEIIKLVENSIVFASG